jgi:hypothetical protein
VIVPDGNEVAYTLQVAVEGADERTWADVAMVLVRPRTKHMTVIRRALAEGDVDVPEDGLDVRLLDAETAEPIRVLPPPREPGPRELRL